MPRLVRFRYTPIPRRNPLSGEVKDVFLPLLGVSLVGNHRVGRAVLALVDSGSEINLFPAQYAEVYFGMNERVIRKGERLEIRGIGTAVIDGFKHFVTMHNPELRLERTPVYFSYEHDGNLPILGRQGFFDCFRRVTFYQGDKIIELELL